MIFITLLIHFRSLQLTLYHFEYIFLKVIESIKRKIFFQIIKYYNQNKLNKMSNYSLMFKFIIIGDVGVGKSCIVLRLTENNVRETHEPTIGVEFGAKIMKVDDTNIKLQIWDTAGQENFRSIIRSYYRSAIGALLVYDITKRETFHNLQIWMDEIRNNGNPNMVIMLIGNKVDKQIEREVTFEEGLEFSKTHKLMFMETCATNGTNVESSFYYATLQILRDIQDQKIFVGQDPGIKVGREYQQQKELDNQQNQPLKLNKKNSKKCC
ncbi:hypothetical protein pb186bvf_000687 [Paramecium bursaria]